MDILIACTVVAVALLAVGCVLLWKGGADLRREEQSTPPAPVVVERIIERAAEQPKPPAPTPITLRLVSGSGRCDLGSVKLADKRLRRATLRHRSTDGALSVFVQSHQNTAGEWVYRRVGVERER